jgi:hypothetical protein
MLDMGIGNIGEGEVLAAFRKGLFNQAEGKVLPRAKAPAFLIKFRRLLLNVFIVNSSFSLPFGQVQCLYIWDWLRPS